jgi:hypothetical protein
MTTKLVELLRTMELPEWRKNHLTIHNVRWLSRNMGLKNSTHPNYNESIELIKSIIREGLVT